MIQVKISNGKGKRTEIIGGVELQSSGGVPPQWAALTEFLPARGRVLDYGSWQGVAALWLKACRRDAQVTFAHYSSCLVAQAAENAASSQLAIQSQAMFPLTGQWDTIILAAPEQREAMRLLACQAAACLNPGGELLVAASSPRDEELGEHFAKISEVAAGEHWTILRCTDPRQGSVDLPWQKLSVQVRGLELELASLPGNFSPGGLDQGTRLMLEEALIPKGGRVLDLGCGYGVVGIVAAKLGAGEAVFVDDDFIALTACSHNLQGLGINGELVHSHLPAVLGGKFDCILTNPPYHADYGVASSFLEFAARSLNPQGWVYVVIKKSDWYRNKLQSLFGGCRAVEGDGYWLLSSQKHLKTGQANAAAKTTRKHRRKQCH